MKSQVLRKIRMSILVLIFMENIKVILSDGIIRNLVNF
jgi:hypothetical protein